jgi:glycosyltransferase involved in cell wall biosynthesis
MDYRLLVYEELYRRCGGSFEVWSGVKAFTASSGQPAVNYGWHRDLQNFFLVGRRALWQSGHLSAAFQADVCVLEFNPRILSNWVILLYRRLFGLRTVIWGHLFPRAGMYSRTTPVRMTMLALAGEANLYTHSEARIFREKFPWLRANVSSNAVMWRRECYSGAVSSKKRHRLLFVARLVDEKKPGLLLEGFAQAIPHLPADICLDFVGSGPCGEALRKRTGELGLSKRVNFHGALYKTEDLRPLYEHAVMACSPGYVGLSATQAFGFGVPMLVAKEEQHSVEIELCREGFNTQFFPSDSPKALAAALISFVNDPQPWALRYDEIAAQLRETYTLDSMCDGFMSMFAAHVTEFAPWDAPRHVAIAWLGLPYYAARVIKESMQRHPGWKFTIISSRDIMPYTGIDEMLGQRVHWIDSAKPVTWKALGETYPDMMLITSWPHAAYRALANEAKDQYGSQIVVMFDNYLRYTPKQIAGYFYYRMVLDSLFSATWVPGEYSRRFARFLGAKDADIYTGLYAADHDVFYPPDGDFNRVGIVFVGQLVARKGLRHLAFAAAQLRSEGRPLQLSVHGCGPLEAALEGAGVEIKPFKQANELANVYRGASALILPSRIDHWGVVAHEAALCGCVLLVTKQCGCAKELVTHGVNGYVMSCSSTKEIIAAIEWWEGLSSEALASARVESIRLARLISPKRWADTLDELVGRFTNRPLPASKSE